MDYLKLKRERNRKGYTQVEMARLLGVHLHTYRLWETGCGQPSPGNLKKLQRILDVGESA